MKGGLIILYRVFSNYDKNRFNHDLKGAYNINQKIRKTDTVNGSKKNLC